MAPVSRRIVVKFQNGEGVSLGHQIDLDLNTSKEELNELVKALSPSTT